MEEMRPIDTINERVRCVCTRWNTDEEVDHSLGRDIGALEHGHIRVWKLFGMECLQTLQDCLNAPIANHAIEPFNERTP